MANKSNSSILIFILVIFSLILNQFPSWSQDNNIQFTASYPSEVAANEPFDVVFSINAPHSKDFKAPGFRGFNILFGPAQSQSSSMQFINGVSSQSFALSYSYRLQAPTPGDFRFDPATIVVDGKKYATPSIRIKVSSSKSSSSRSNGNGSASNNRNSESTASSATISNKDLFIRSSINKSNPYLGEEIILTYRIYTAVPVEQYNIYKTPSNKGFWAEELKLNNHEQKTEIINNRRYIFADIRKVALFGQETGNLTLEPMEIEALAQVQAPRRGGSGSIFDIFDDPFFDPVQYVKKNLRSEAIHIKVKPLPTEGKPASFNGLVGNYKVSFSYDQEKEIRSNEAISFKFKVIGKGNIELVQQPNLLFPPDFDVYEPKITHQKNISESGINGTTQYEYIVVPRNPGVYKINAFDFSFFNPQSAKYETITIPEIVLNVKQGNGNAYSSSGTNQQNIRLLNSDIEYIRTHNPQCHKLGQNFFPSLSFFLCLLTIFILFFFVLLWNKKHLQKQNDIVGLLNRRATKEAKRCLKKAHSFMNQNKKDEFYIEISQALWGFLSHKLNIPQASLSMESVHHELSTKEIKTELIEEFIKTLDDCEFERFAPQGNSMQSMNEIYEQALHIIYKIVKELK